MGERHIRLGCQGVSSMAAGWHKVAAVSLMHLQALPQQHTLTPLVEQTADHHPPPPPLRHLTDCPLGSPETLATGKGHGSLWLQAHPGVGQSPAAQSSSEAPETKEGEGGADTDHRAETNTAILHMHAGWVQHTGGCGAFSSRMLRRCLLRSAR